MNTELILYYVNLLIVQYRGKPKAEATIQALADALMIFDLIRAVQNGYDIETAIGLQLDVLGKYIGTQRTVTGVDFTRTYFGYILYSATPPVPGIAGYTKYADPLPDVSILTYLGDTGSILDLNDAELRFISKLKIKKNYTAASVKDADDILFELFDGNASIVDNEDMTIDYEFPADQQRIVTIATSLGVIPKPMGVTQINSFV